MDYIQNLFVSDKINWSVSIDAEEANDRADRSESKLKEKEDELKAVEKGKVDMKVKWT